MSEENKNIDTNEVIVVEEVKESKFKEFTSKAGAVIKKHGKKIAAVAVVGAGILVGYALGRKSEDDDSDFDLNYDDETIDDCSEVEEVEETE